MICIVCKEEVLKTDDKFYLGLDKPYVNLPLHRKCWLSIKDKLNYFLPENEELLYNIIEESNKNRKK
jgi:hypothetical protein